jgi:hypothetical protein
MKKIILVSLFALFATVAFCQIPADKAVTIPEGKAIVYIVRPSSALGMFRTINKIDGTELKTLGGYEYVYKIVDPGKISVVCKGSSKESPIEVNAEAGKTYVVVQQVMSQIIGVYYCRLSITEDPAKMAKYFKKSTWSN